MFLKETSWESKESCAGRGRQGGIQQNMCNHPTRAAMWLLAEAQLCHGEEECTQRHVNPSRKLWRSNNGAHHSRQGGTNDTLGDTWEAVYPSRRSLNLQWGTIQTLWIHRQHACVKSGTRRDIQGASQLGHSNNRTVWWDSSHPQASTSKFHFHCHHPRAMKTTLENSQLRDVVIRVWYPFWSLHCGE